MSPLLPRDVAQVVYGYGEQMICEKLWNYYNVNDFRYNFPTNIVLVIQLLHMRIEENQEHKIDFQSQVKESPMSSQIARLLIHYYILWQETQERQRSHSKTCSAVSKNGGGGNE